MEISVQPWKSDNANHLSGGLFDDHELIDYTEENSIGYAPMKNQKANSKQTDSLSEESKSDSSFASKSSSQAKASTKNKKKAKQISVNTTKCLGEMKLMRLLIAKNKWKECLMGDDGDVLWAGCSMNGEQTYYQSIAVNRLPKMEELAHKKQTGQFLNLFREYFPHHFDFFPRTYLVPEQLNELKSVLGKKKDKMFISKPSSGAQGDGIKLVQAMSDLQISAYTPHANELVVQEYLANPMIIKDKKFDLRLYVLVSSLDPLIVYIHEEGLARFCTEPYQKPSKENINNPYMHLTNYSLNKNSPNFKLPTKEDVFNLNDASKRTMHVTWQQIIEAGYDKEEIIEQIEHLVRKFIASMHPYLLFNYKLAFNNKEPKRFHVIGFDILLDDKGKPWFLEANANPSFNIQHEVYESDGKKRVESSPLDEYVKCRVAEDAIRLILKPIEKQLAIGRGNTYRGFKMIIQDDLQPEFEDMDLFSDMLHIYGKLSGCKFNASLTSSKFSKLANLNGMKNSTLIKTDYDLIFMKVLLNTEDTKQMSFQYFITALEVLTQRLLPNIFSPENKLPAVLQLVANIKSQI